MKSFRVDACVRVPRPVTVVEFGDAPGDMPKKLGTTSVICPHAAFRVNGVLASFGPSFEPLGHAQNQSLFEAFDVGLLTVQIDALDPDEALSLAQPAIEQTLDYLSFSLQSHLPAVSLQVLDVSPPLSVGQMRCVIAYAEVDALIRPKFQRMLIPPTLLSGPQPIGPLSDLSPPTSSRLKLALWWYVKALATPYLVDRLLFLFTSVEQLAHPHETGPYRTSCNHLISSCPECGSSVSRPLPGQSIKKYLVEVAGLTQSESNALWSARQAVHGRDIFDSALMGRIGELSGRLSSALNRALKSEFQQVGKSVSPPVHEASLVSVAGARLVLERAISENDLRLAQTFASLA